MRRPRLKLLHQPACYHVICRITQGQAWLGVPEKTYLMGLLHQVAKYCGVEVLTFCVMSNHFHLLVSVPVKAVADAALGSTQMINRVQQMYGRAAAERLRGLMQDGAAPGAGAALEEECAIHLGRMHDLSVFMKLLKQRFTMWHNRCHDTRGTLWTERFKSVLVESRSGGSALAMVAAYIDLNPVRAGVVAEAKEYPYSGAGSAADGNQESQHGLNSLAVASGTEAGPGNYEQLMGESLPDKESPTETAPKATGLRSRQNALVKSAVLGSAAFVMEVLSTLMHLRRNVGPMIHSAGPLGGDLWVERKFRKR